MCGIGAASSVQQCGRPAQVDGPGPVASAALAPTATATATADPGGKPTGSPTQGATDAKLAEMTRRMAAADGFDAKNAIFHEYFDAVPKDDKATATQYFATFMTNIPKADADRVNQFLAGLDAQEQAKAAAAERRAKSTAPEGVLMIGDSLSVGTKQSFSDGLTGVPTSVDATGGIPLKEGMRRYDAVAVKPRVVEMALFTNNAPGQIDELRAALDTTIADARARGGRVVWATIKGNPSYGSYDAVNAMLRDYAAKNADAMGLVDWAKMVSDHPDYLAGDKIHGTPAGYKARAQAFADAAKA